MNDISTEHKHGFVALCGKPNTGKSTLLNRLVGQKIAAVSSKPQTTRHKITGILTEETYQLVFLDLPGIIQPLDKFNEGLMETVGETLEGIDVLCYLLDAAKPVSSFPEHEQRIIGLFRGPRILVINKIDLVDDSFDSKTVASSFPPDFFSETICISASKDLNVGILIESILRYCPEGPRYYDSDDMSDRDMRFFAAEIVREKVFKMLGEEVPYSVATQTEEYREEPHRMPHIRVVIYVEKESQKPIIIGKGGEKIKKIGIQARKDIEFLTGETVFLDLWVKVRKNWKKNEYALKEFGYKPLREKK